MKILIVHPHIVPDVGAHLGVAGFREQVRERPFEWACGTGPWYRVLLPARHLTAAGHQVWFTDKSTINHRGRIVGTPSWPWIVRNYPLEEPDIVVFGLNHDPGVVDQIRAAKVNGGQALVAEIDDYVWGKHKGVAADAFTVWRKTLQAVDLITTSTQWLADALGGGPPVRVLPNAIPLQEHGLEDITDGPVVGYTGVVAGAHQHDVSALLSPWFGPFVEKHDLRVIHFGHRAAGPSFASLAKVDPARVEVRGDVAVTDYAAARPMRGMDIGLVPLAAKHWNDSSQDGPRLLNSARSELKGLEYAACGVPFVASPSPAYQGLGFGVLAGQSLEDQSPKAWTEALERLLDRAVRQSVSEDQLRKVASYDIAERWRDWESCYQGLLSAKGLALT